MTEKPLTRGKAIAWWAILFILSVFGTAFVIRRWYLGEHLWWGMFLYALLFVCTSMLGLKADYEQIKKGLGAGLKTLIEPEPVWAAAAVIVLVLIWPLAGFAWFWRATLPLAAGIIAGFKWARQEPVPDDDIKFKSRKEEDSAVDIWKP